MSSQYQDPVIRLLSGRTVDLRNVDPSRLMTAAECREVAAALRHRVSLIQAHIRTQRMDAGQKSKASRAASLTNASRDAVLGRLTFLLRAGDQHVDLMSDAARFVEAARRRLGRDVFEAIMADARAHTAATFDGAMREGRR